MKTEIENTNLRKIIDTSYQSGYNACLENVIKWINNNISNYIWFDESEVSSGECCGVNDDFEEDLRKYLESHEI